MSSEQQYSRLAPQAADNAPSALSRFSSTSSLKDYARQGTILTQNGSRPRARGFKATVKGWWLELASLTLAVAVMICSVVLLAHYNRKPIYEAPQSPNLNTLINIFSTIEAGLIAYVTAEVLSQDKWHRFSSEASLTDFNIIDTASRGVRGSFQVLIKPSLGFMALAGALTSLLAILIGPMLQETVEFRNAYLADPVVNSSAPISRFFAPPTNPQLPKVDVGLKGTILNGLSFANTSAIVPRFGCSSGNCTFQEPYTSLAICHHCEKVPVNRQCVDQQPVGSCNYTLANGHVLTNPILNTGDVNFINVSTAFNATSQMSRFTNDDLKRDLALTRASIISLTNGPNCQTNGSNPECVLPNRDNTTQEQLVDGGYFGAFCDLTVCANTYKATVNESRVDERQIASADARDLSAPHYYLPTEEGHDDPVIVPNECYIDNHPFKFRDFQDSKNKSWSYVELYKTTADAHFTYPAKTVKVPVDCVFAIRNITYQSINMFMTGNPTFLDGHGTSDSTTGVAGGLFSFYGNGLDMAFQTVNQNFGIEPLFHNGNASFEMMNRSFDRLASAMTTYMRQNSGQTKKRVYEGVEDQLAEMAPNAPGVLYRQRTIIVVQWLWVILPLAVLLSTCCYLTAAIIQGGVKDANGHTQAKLWKSNAIVPLAIGQNSELFDTAEALQSHEDMKSLKKRKVTLIETKHGWAFVDTRSREMT